MTVYVTLIPLFPFLDEMFASLSVMYFLSFIRSHSHISRLRIKVDRTVSVCKNQYLYFFFCSKDFFK